VRAGGCEGAGTGAVVVQGKCDSSVGRRTGARCVVVGQWTLALRPVSIRMHRVATRAYNQVESMFEVWNMGLNCRSLG